MTEIALVKLPLDECQFDLTDDESTVIGSGNGLVPSGNKPLPEPMVTQISVAEMASLGLNELIRVFLLQSFSSIIGPNGSGKSNVIDSMLFVFGYRANKIRSKKISVLLHNSEQHKNITSCTVAVHFQKIIDTGVSSRSKDLKKKCLKCHEDVVFCFYILY